MTVFEDLSLDSPLKLHEDSIDCLEDEVADLARVFYFVVDKEVAQNRLYAKENKVFRLSSIEGGLVLNFQDVEEYLLLDFNDSLVILKIP